MQADPQTRQRPAGTGRHVAQNSNFSVQSTSVNALPKAVDDIELPPWRMVRHAAALIDAALTVIYSGKPISILGRRVLVDTADRLRQLSQVLQ